MVLCRFCLALSMNDNPEVGHVSSSVLSKMDDTCKCHNEHFAYSGSYKTCHGMIA